MMRPAFIKQFAELTEQDFVAHPVWVAVHGMDEDEDWYDDCDEESFRPWTEPLPVGPDKGMLLVRAQFTLADGTQLGGFITPQPAGKPLSLGIVQPQIFTAAAFKAFGRECSRALQANAQPSTRAWKKPKNRFSL